MTGKIGTYWAATILFSGFMAFNAYAYLARDPKMMASFSSLGYPSYFPTILGIAKILGVLALLIPGVPRLKEWAYAGFTFTLLGAFFSHQAIGQTKESFLPAIVLVVMIISYWLRPPNRAILTLVVE